MPELPDGDGQVPAVQAVPDVQEGQPVPAVPVVPPIPTDSYPKPDFVLFGISDPSGIGVILFASRHLTSAVMEEKRTPRSVQTPFGLAHLEDRSTELACTMADVMAIRGYDYGDALRSIAQLWADNGGRLNNGPLALEGGDDVSG